MNKRVIVIEVGEKCPNNYLCMPTSPLLAKESDSGKRFCKKTHKECSEENCPLPALAERNSHISINDEDYDRGLKAGWNACLDAIAGANKQ